MIIAIYNRIFEEHHVPVYNAFFEAVQEHHIELSVYKELHEKMQGYFEFENIILDTFSSADELNPKTDFFISFGGDGTILDTVLYVTDKDIPILGINLGRLGFLADVPKEDISFAVQCLMNRNYTIETRNLIKLDSNNGLFDKQPFALNDFTLLKKDSSSMIKINTYLNGQFLNTYWCDGLIVATPTGSTGYSLSCGGPIIFPQTNAFVITPISPHNLNVRPLVVPNDYVISFEVEGRTDQFLCTLDSRQATIDKTVMLAVRKADFSIRLVRIGSNNFLDTIKNKMHWGIDNRN